jgi:hypothetical protein
MSPPITFALAASFVASACLILLDGGRHQGRWLVLMLLAFGVIRFFTGFPTSRQAFGGFRPELAIFTILACAVLGSAARYVFFLRGRVRVRALLRPVCISPIVLLPLLSSIQSLPELSSLQLISFGCLAFQNGFFWQTVLAQAKLSVGEPLPLQSGEESPHR